MTRYETAALPAPLGRIACAKPAQAGRSPAGPFMAQAMGQGGERRGLRGGAPVMTTARAAYLGAEWSGAGDRRAIPGRLRRHSA